MICGSSKPPSVYHLTVSHTFCALSQPQGLLRSLASEHGGRAIPPCARVTELLPTSTAHPSLAPHPAGHHSLPGHILQPNPVSSTSVVSVEELKAFSVSGELVRSKGTFLSELQCLSTSGDARQLHRRL